MYASRKLRQVSKPAPSAAGDAPEVKNGRKTRLWGSDGCHHVVARREQVLPDERGPGPPCGQLSEVRPKNIDAPEAAREIRRRGLGLTRHRQPMPDVERHGSFEHLHREVQAARADGAHPSRFSQRCEALPLARVQSAGDPIDVVKKDQAVGIVVMRDTMDARDEQRVNIAEPASAALRLGDRFFFELGVREDLGEGLRIGETPVHVVRDFDRSTRADVTRLMRDVHTGWPRETPEAEPFEHPARGVYVTGQDEQIRIAARPESRRRIVSRRERRPFEQQRSYPRLGERRHHLGEIATLNSIDQHRLASELAQTLGDGAIGFIEFTERPGIGQRAVNERGNTMLNRGVHQPVIDLPRSGRRRVISKNGSETLGRVHGTRVDLGERRSKQHAPRGRMLQEGDDEFAVMIERRRPSHDGHDAVGAREIEEAIDVLIR